MALNNYYDYLKEKPIYYRIIIYGVLFLALLNFFMNVWGYKQVAIYKSKSSENIIEGCAYYGGGYKDKYGDGFYIIVDGYVVKDLYVNIRGNNFPFEYKGKDFYRSLGENVNYCHKIKYIEKNLYFVKKIFIYDYVV